MSYITTTLQVLLVAWLPGALVFRAPVADRAERWALDFEERLFWEVIVSLALSSGVILTLSAAGQYSLLRLLAVNAFISAAIVAVFRSRLLPRRPAGPLRWTAAIPAALVLLGAVLFFPPAEHVVGGKDPGVYLNEGVQLARTGSFVIQDEVVSRVPPRMRDLFFPSHGNPTYYGLRFMGFRILDPDAGTIIGQFPHLYPGWLAVGYGIGGLQGALRTTGWWAVFGLVALYVAGKKVTGTGAAGVAAALMGISVVQIWFAREPNSEMVAQPLVLAAIAAFTQASTRRDRFFGVLGGVLLGLLFFLRLFDAVIAATGIFLAAALLLADRRRPPLSFLVSFALAGGLGILYLRNVMAAYTELPAVFLANLGRFQVTLAAAGLASLVAVALASRWPSTRRALRTAIPWGFVLAVAAAAIYAYFFRQPAGRLAWHDASSLRTFTWYLPLPALAAALVGYVFLAWRNFWVNTAWVTSIAVSSFVVFYKIRVVPEHFWMTRRFLTLILPAAILLMCGLAFVPVNRRRSITPTQPGEGRRWLLGMALPFVFLALVGASLARASRPILDHVEYAGVNEKLEALAARFQPDDLVIVESRNSSDMHVLALPLAYVYGRNVLLLDTPKPDKLMFGEYLRVAHTHYRDVYFLGGGGTDLLSRSTRVTPVGSERFQLPEYESPTNRYPSEVRFKEFDFGIYRFDRPGEYTGSGNSGYPSVDIGHMDDLHVVRFHAKERTGETTFRWTRDVSYVSLPGLDAKARALTLWAGDGGRPPGAVPAFIRVFLDNEPVGEARVVGGFRPYRFEIPASIAEAAGQRDEPLLMRIVVDTWNPHDLMRSGDNRELGVMLDRVEVE